jgi:flavin reductase (DIM6/NTAB) family NADH-FMN oxidoreductase RutF
MTNDMNQHDFLPDPANTRPLRDALGRFSTGVTVITTQTETGPVGFTANSFAAVSLDPALVLWSPAKSSARFPVFAAAQTFCIHILGADQLALATRFVRGGAGFDGLESYLSTDGIPVIPAALARFECRQHSLHDGGDHLIIVGRVIRFAHADGAPLVFSQGSYGSFSATP